MSQRRGTTTNRLMNIIQVIQLGKKTGRLTVERGDAQTLEAGEIIFAQGQVVKAYKGNLQGDAALNWLSSWGTCRFFFIPLHEDEKSTGPLKAITPVPPAPHVPTQSLQDTNPSLPATPHSTKQDTGGLHALPQNSPQVVPRQLYPAKKAFRLLDKAGLSRAHRHLFLLIDGQRTLPDLVRLTGRTLLEIQNLLQDLELIGVVK